MTNRTAILDSPEGRSRMRGSVDFRAEDEAGKRRTG